MGRTEQYTLGFLERPPDEPGVRKWDVVAESLHIEPRYVGAPHVPPTDEVFCDVLLHGDGWAAYWPARRSVAPGPARLRGLLFWNWPHRSPATLLRGRVERVQVVSKAVDTSDPDPGRWSVAPRGWALRDVATSPTMFDRGHHPGNADQPQVPYPNPWVSETGVLVTLDTEHAGLMPDAVAVHGDDLWVADRDRSIVLRIRRPRDPVPQVTAFAWEPAAAYPADRRLHADAAGCWITDATGVRRVDAQRGVRLVDDVPAGGLAYGRRRHPHVAAAGDDATLALILPAATADDPRDRLRRYRPTGDVLDDVVLPGITRTVVADGDGFLLQWLAGSAHPVGDDVEGEWRRVSGDRSLEELLGRVDAGGAVTTDPVSGTRPHEERAVLIGPDPPVHYTSSARTLRTLRGVRPSGTAFDVNPWLRTARHGATDVSVRADRLFVSGQLGFTDPSDPASPTTSWPFAGRHDRGEDGGYWVAELDPATLEPLRAATVPRAPRHLDVDAEGTVWVQADHRTQSWRVHHLPLDHPWGTPAPFLLVADLDGGDGDG